MFCRSFGSALGATCVFMILNTVFMYFLTGNIKSISDSLLALQSVSVLLIVNTVSAYNLTAASPSFSDYDEAILDGCFKGFDRASILFRKGMSRLADSCLSAALELLRSVDDYDLTTREQAVLYYYTGICYRKMGYPSNGAAYFMKSVRCGLSHPDASMNAFRCYAAAGNIGDAEELFAEMTEKNYHVKYYDYLFTELGMMYLRADRPDDAIDRFSRGISLGMDAQSSYGGISLAYILKDDMEKSRVFYRKAMLGNIPDRDGFREYYRITARNCGHSAEAAVILDDDADTASV